MKICVGFYHILGMIYIALLTGMTISVVGQTPEPVEAYSWTLPITVFLILSVPFALGIQAGKGMTDDN